MQPIIRHTLYLIMYIDKNKFCRILKATDYIAYKSKFLKSWKSTSAGEYCKITTIICILLRLYICRAIINIYLT